MKNFMNFDMRVQSVFENGADDFANFYSLMVDTARGTQKVSKQEANDKIREIFCQIIGVNEHSSTKEVRQAIRRNQTFTTYLKMYMQMLLFLVGRTIRSLSSL